MSRRVFLSYHYVLDAHRASQIRDCGLIQPSDLASDHVWSAITRAGDTAIERWIDKQMRDTECTIVLIGQITAGRKWIDYEIRKSWQEGRGIFGIHIHHLKNELGSQTGKGGSPFAAMTLNGMAEPLTDNVRVYDPPYLASGDAYEYIEMNLANWIERAIANRRPQNQRWPATLSA